MLTTPKEATEVWICPLARTFGGNAKTLHSACRGAACALWRWVKIDAGDPRIVSAISARLDEIAGDDPTKRSAKHQAAVKYVMAHREELGLPVEPDRGYCGLGGRPEA